MKIWTLAAAIVFLSACAYPEPEGAADLAAAAYEPPASSPSEASACETAGGTWRREGMLGSYMCVMPHADAGQPCTDSDQCAGDCRLGDDKRPAEGEPVTGICQADTSNFGCFTRVEDGRVAHTLCVD